MTELIKKILKWLGIAVGAYVCLALIIFAVTMIASAINPAEPISKVAVVDQTNTDVEEESKEETVVEEELEKETTTTEEQEEDTSISEPEFNEEKTDFITKAKDKVNEIKKEHDEKKKQDAIVHPHNKKEISKWIEKCTYDMSNLGRLEQYDKNLIIVQINKLLVKAAKDIDVEANKIDTDYIRVLLSIYWQLYWEDGVSESYTELYGIFSKCNKLQKELPSKRKINKAIEKIDKINEEINNAKVIDLYVYKREDSSSLGLSFILYRKYGKNVYFCKDGDQDVFLYTDENYEEEGYYKVAYKDVTDGHEIYAEYDNGLRKPALVYAHIDISKLEESINEYAKTVEAPEKLLNARKKLIKLLKRGL